MSPQQADKQQIIDEVNRRLERDRTRPLKIAIMGQTGVGKSSLINALFATHLKTDAVRPCTKEIECVIAKGIAGHELWFYDLPGIGESEKADAHYLQEYRKMLLESDIVMWAIHADNRSLYYDFEVLNQIIGSFDEGARGELLSRITFVLTKVDLIAPAPWLLTKMGDEGVFVVHPETQKLLQQKELYCQETFLRPFQKLLVARTYHQGNFNISAPNLSYDRYNVYYQGLLCTMTNEYFKKRFPEQSEVFDRLRDSYRVIPCSSLFKFNFPLLMRVIIDKLGEEAVARFKNFYNNQEIYTIAYAQAKKYCNMMLIDGTKGQVIFDMATAKL